MIGMSNTKKKTKIRITFDLISNERNYSQIKKNPIIYMRMNS